MKSGSLLQGGVEKKRHKVPNGNYYDFSIVANMLASQTPAFAYLGDLFLPGVQRCFKAHRNDGSCGRKTSNTVDEIKSHREASCKHPAITCHVLPSSLLEKVYQVYLPKHFQFQKNWHKIYRPICECLGERVSTRSSFFMLIFYRNQLIYEIWLLQLWSWQTLQLPLSKAVNCRSTQCDSEAGPVI